MVDRSVSVMQLDSLDVVAARTGGRAHVILSDRLPGPVQWMVVRQVDALLDDEGHQMVTLPAGRAEVIYKALTEITE